MEFNDKKNVIILHDSGGEPYFEAVEYLEKKGKIESVSYYETSAFFNFIKSVLKKNYNFSFLFGKIVKNLKFRVSSPFLKNKVIILGMAPYDFRFIFYALLSFNNKVIYHSSWPYWWQEKYPRRYGFLDFFLKRIFSFYLRNLPLDIVGVIPEVKDSLESRLPLANVTVIPHCINSEVFSIDSKVRESAVKHILFVGRIQKEKGIDKMISIIKDFNSNGFHFHIVGDGIMFEEMNRELMSNKNVTIYGRVKGKNKLSAIFRKCDFLLLPSIRNKKWEELFGVVIIEAMASGLVVIASNHVGPRNIIEDGVDGIIYDFSRSNNELKVKIENCDLNNMSNLAVKKSLNYSIESVSELWFGVINK